MDRLTVIIVISLVITLAIPVAGAQPNNSTILTHNTSIVEKRSIESSQGIKHKIRFNTENYVIDVKSNNGGDEVVKTILNVKIDGEYSYSSRITLSSDEEWDHSFSLLEYLDINKYRHNITVSTYGAHTDFKLYKPINEINKTTVPKPKITNITIKNGTIDGEPSAVAKVTVENPSIHTYPTKLMVHTQETDGSFYGASVPPGESRTFTVELLDERGAQIAGEARLYTGNLTTTEGAMDQVEFVGEADADTSQWNASYKPVNPPWMEDRYQYKNESLDEPTWAERVSNGNAIGGVPAVYVGLGGLVAVLLGGLTRRVL